MFGKHSGELICPLLRKGCVETSCAFWVTIMGKHPQTGVDLNMPDCAIRWLPTLLIEGSKVGRETGAAVESFRNEMTKANILTANLMVDAQKRLLSDAR